MANLFRAFLFKLRRDLTFKITLFIGLGFAVLMTVIYLFIDNFLADSFGSSGVKLCTGQGLFLNSLSPVQNFGISIPVNLISFTILEFNQGIIRNKIIAGNSKFKIYVGLFLSGLVFTILVLMAYALLCLGLGSIFGGFDINGIAMVGLGAGKSSPEFFWKVVGSTLLLYVCITSMTIFFSTLFRSIGPTIPCVILILFGLYFASTIIMMFDTSVTDTFVLFNPFNPVVCPTIGDSGALVFDNKPFIASLINNSVYAVLFFVAGSILFVKRDIK